MVETALWVDCQWCDNLGMCFGGTCSLFGTAKEEAAVQTAVEAVCHVSTAVVEVVENGGGHTGRRRP